MSNNYTNTLSDDNKINNTYKNLFSTMDVKKLLNKKKVKDLKDLAGSVGLTIASNIKKENLIDELSNPIIQERLIEHLNLSSVSQSNKIDKTSQPSPKNGLTHIYGMLGAFLAIIGIVVSIYLSMKDFHPIKFDYNNQTHDQQEANTNDTSENQDNMVINPIKDNDNKASLKSKRDQYKQESKPKDLCIGKDKSTNNKFHVNTNKELGQIRTTIKKSKNKQNTEDFSKKESEKSSGNTKTYKFNVPANAYFSLGLKYRNNPDSMFKYLRLSHKKGYSSAKNLLASYLISESFKDSLRAEEYLLEASNLGNSTAQLILARTLKGKDIEESLYWYRMAEQNGSKYAMKELTNYLLHLGYKDSTEKSIEYLKEAAKRAEK